MALPTLNFVRPFLFIFASNMVSSQALSFPHLSSRGELSKGDAAPNVEVVSINNQPRRLLHYQRPNQPLILIAGSYT
jgi:hypothetical protein